MSAESHVHKSSKKSLTLIEKAESKQQRGVFENSVATSLASKSTSDKRASLNG
jgi:hypothetical protein